MSALGLIGLIIGCATILTAVYIVASFTYKGSHGYNCVWQERAEDWRKEAEDLRQQLRDFKEAK